MFDSGVVHIAMASDIVAHYCFMFDRGVVHIIVAGYNVDHYCFMFDRGVVHIIVAGYNVDHYCFNGQQYNQLQQYEPPLCQISNSNGQRYHQP
jgi:hypothetical protein